MSAITSTFDDTIQAVIDREYGSARHGAKLLARHARASVAAARHWIYGRRTPTGEQLINLMAQNDALAEAIHQLVAERRSKEKYGTA